VSALLVRLGAYRGWWLGLLLGLAGCQPSPTAAPPGQALPPSALAARFQALLRRGDAAYAQKRGYRSFAQAQRSYDSARALADRSGDTLLLAEAVFAQARVYDAWNQEPRQTVAYFQRAADLFGRRPAAWRRYFYARYLVAHAYEKVPDSLHAVQTLRGLLPDLAAFPDTARRRAMLAVEMALTSTEVRNYALADTLLRRFVNRPGLLRDDPATYDYRTHYYLVQSRLDVRYRHRPASSYLDSLALAYRGAGRRLDRLFLSQQLAHLLAEAGRYPAAYRFLSTAVGIGDSLADGGDLAELRQTLVRSEQRAEAQAAAAQQSRTRATWALGAAVVVISLLSFYLARQSRLARQQARRLARANQQLGTANTELARVNEQLDDKVAQVELLNKEIQHRVKNNLHILFSLLRMQERRATSPDVLAQLQAARLRVESIAALHNQLMRRPHDVSLADFLRTLTATVVACLANERQVITHLQTDALALAQDSYFPLSLILNELITNSVKYADTQGQPLELTVRVVAQPEGTRFSYADNGRAPEHADRPDYGARPDPAAAAGLGTQIITLLARQLRATLHTPAPYHYELLIPPVLVFADDDLLPALPALA